MTFPRALRAARERAGLTQVELAARLGIGQPTVAEFENDKTNLTEATAARYLEACGAELQGMRVRWPKETRNT